MHLLHEPLRRHAAAYMTRNNDAGPAMLGDADYQRRIIERIDLEAALCQPLNELQALWGSFFHDQHSLSRLGCWKDVRLHGVAPPKAYHAIRV